MNFLLAALFDQGGVVNITCSDPPENGLGCAAAARLQEVLQVEGDDAEVVHHLG